REGTRGARSEPAPVANLDQPACHGFLSAASSSPRRRAASPPPRRTRAPADCPRAPRGRPRRSPALATPLPRRRSTRVRVRGPTAPGGRRSRRSRPRPHVAVTARPRRGEPTDGAVGLGDEHARALAREDLAPRLDPAPAHLETVEDVLVDDAAIRHPPGLRVDASDRCRVVDVCLAHHARNLLEGEYSVA